MTQKGLVFLLSCMIQLLAFAAAAQKGTTRDITGQVTDSKGIPVPNVTIAVKGTQKSVVSNVEGKFTIKVPAGKNILQFSSVGYADQEISLGTSTSVDIKLAEAVKGLDDVVVVGYGSQKRQDLTGSVSSINSDHLTSAALSPMSPRRYREAPPVCRCSNQIFRLVGLCLLLSGEVTLLIQPMNRYMLLMDLLRTMGNSLIQMISKISRY